MHKHRGDCAGINRDAADLSHVQPGQDVGNGQRVKSNSLRIGKSPIMFAESWCPQFVTAREVSALFLTFLSIDAFLKTEMVD